MTTRVRLGMKAFRDVGKLLLGQRFTLKMKGMVYQGWRCIASVILHVSKIWCLLEELKNYVEKKPMIGEIFGTKYMERKSSLLLRKGS